MIAFFVGFFGMLFASLPSYLMSRGGKQAEFNTQLKLWAIGMALRFLIIGAILFYLFANTTIDRVPCVIGAAVAYFIDMLAKNFSSKKSKPSDSSLPK